MIILNVIIIIQNILMILIIEVIVGKNDIVIDLKVIVNIHMMIKIMIKKEIKKIKKKALKKVKLNKKI